MLNSFISQKYLVNSKIKSLKSSFVKAKPFPHLVLKGLFNEGVMNNLSKELLKESFVCQETDLFSFSQTNDLVLSKSSTIRSFYDFFNSKEFKEYLFSITGVKAFGKIDASGFVYSFCDYLLPHDDRLENRRIAYALNLSKAFSKSDGGSLDFFYKNKIVKSIIPNFNVLTIFQVIENKTFHQVGEVLSDKMRLSVSGWFNDK